MLAKCSVPQFVHQRGPVVLPAVRAQHQVHLVGDAHRRTERPRALPRRSPVSKITRPWASGLAPSSPRPGSRTSASIDSALNAASNSGRASGPRHRRASHLCGDTLRPRFRNLAARRLTSFGCRAGTPRHASRSGRMAKPLSDSPCRCSRRRRRVPTPRGAERAAVVRASSGPAPACTSAARASSSAWRSLPWLARRDGDRRALVRFPRRRRSRG